MFERFTKAARMAVVGAQQCAGASGARQIRPEHILWGVAETASGPIAAVLAAAGLSAQTIQDAVNATGTPLGGGDADALKSIGIDLDAVRETVEANFGKDVLDHEPPASDKTARRGHIPFSKPGKKSLELALREAIARGDNFIGSEHLLLGLLRGADPAVNTVIAPHIAPTELRLRINDVLDDAA